MVIYDLSHCRYSDRHGLYGGYGGDKDGVIINGERWIVKYPKSTKSMNVSPDLKYTTSPVSEYIGSHIYEILGIKTHKTILGYRNNKIVVAVKDFLSDNERLAEVRTLKNAANKELSEELKIDLNSSHSGDRVNLNELMVHLSHNPIMKSVPGIKMHFWKMVVIDTLIDNNDRNNGNWGIIYGDKKRIAPVYDNGNSFNTKATDEQISYYLNESSEEQEIRITGGRTAFQYNDKTLSAKKALSLDIPELKKSIVELTPIIYEKMPEICDMINDIEEEYKGIEVISPERKEYYTLSVEMRFEKLLVPVYEPIKGHSFDEDIEEKTFMDIKPW